MTCNKKKYGQFYTTNADYILTGFTIPTNVSKIEPFVGSGDLAKWGDIDEVYDIDPKIKNAIIRDTLKNPPKYKNKYVITNPPYLAKNKNKDKTLYNKYKVDDLYKASIISMVNGNVCGGIIIIPLNFLCSQDTPIRDCLFSKYDILKINIFEESVFDDTDIPICAIQFIRKERQLLGTSKSIETKITTYPSKKIINHVFKKSENWMVGGKLYNNVIKSNYEIGRLLENGSNYTNLYLYAIDGGSPNNRIRLEYQTTPYYGKISDRSFATITSNIKIENEKYVINEFNRIIECYRNKYNSLFLTNFRNSTKHYVRKRITFKLAFNIIQHILTKQLFN